MKLFFYLLTLITTLQIFTQSDTVLIFTYSHSRPDFIELHHKTFQAFLQDKYELIVFNDAPNPNMQQQIEQTCRKLNIECIRVPQHLHKQRNDPGARHSHGIKYSLETRGFNHDGIVLLIDADMFLVKPFSALELMKEYEVVGGFQQRKNQKYTITYVAPCLTFLNMNKLPDKITISFDGGFIHGMACDLGAQMHHYFEAHPLVNKKLFTAISTYHLPKQKSELLALGYDAITSEFILRLHETKHTVEFHLKDYFIHHYGGGSNWPKYSVHLLQEKASLINEYVNNAINYHNNSAHT